MWCFTSYLIFHIYYCVINGFKFKSKRNLIQTKSRSNKQSFPIKSRPQQNHVQTKSPPNNSTLKQWIFKWPIHSVWYSELHAPKSLLMRIIASHLIISGRVPFISKSYFDYALSTDKPCEDSYAPPNANIYFHWGWRGFDGWCSLPLLNLPLYPTYTTVR